MRTPTAMLALQLKHSVGSSLADDEFVHLLRHLHREHELPRHHSRELETHGQPVYYREEYQDANLDHRLTCLGEASKVRLDAKRTDEPTRPPGSLNMKELAAELGWTEGLVSRLLRERGVQMVGKLGLVKYYEGDGALAVLRTYTPRGPGGRTSTAREPKSIDESQLVTAEDFLAPLSYKDADITPDLIPELEAELVASYKLKVVVAASSDGPAKYSRTAITEAWRRLLMAEDQI